MRLLLLLFIAISLSLNAVGFLQPEEAFAPKVSLKDKELLKLEIVLGDQIYLYQDKVIIEDGDKVGSDIAKLLIQAAGQNRMDLVNQVGNYNRSMGRINY
jgi:thiol:disulfide interchange protein